MQHGKVGGCPREKLGTKKLGAGKTGEGLFKKNLSPNTYGITRGRYIGLHLVATELSPVAAGGH